MVLTICGARGGEGGGAETWSYRGCVLIGSINDRCVFHLLFVILRFISGEGRGTGGNGISRDVKECIVYSCE